MTEIALFITIIGLALVDSINPSALAMTAYILLNAREGDKQKSVFLYVLGVFITYLLVGIALLAGIDMATKLFTANSARWFAGAQGVLGAVMVLWAVTPHKPRTRREWQPTAKPLALVALGATITFVELSTAFPYIAAIGLLHQTHIHTIYKAGLLLIYNAIFVAPPLIMLALYRYRGAALIAWVQRKASRGQTAHTTEWIIGIVGVILFLDSIGAVLSK